MDGSTKPEASTVLKRGYGAFELKVATPREGANPEIHPAEPAGWSRDGVPGSVGILEDAQDQRRSLRGRSNRKRITDSAGTWTSLPRVMICAAAPAPAPEAAPMAAPFPPPAIAPMIAPSTAPPPTYLPVRAFPPTPSCDFAALHRTCLHDSSPCHGDGINVQRNIPIHFNSPRYQPDVRASWNRDRAVGIANIFFDLCREGLSFDDISRIDSLVGPHGHFRTHGKNDALHARLPVIAVFLISVVSSVVLVPVVDGVFTAAVFWISVVISVVLVPVVDGADGVFGPSIVA